MRHPRTYPIDGQQIRDAGAADRLGGAEMLQQRPLAGRADAGHLVEPGSADGFLARTRLSLPSEAQWEYACRGGTRTAFSFGNQCNARNCDPVCATANDHMWWECNSGREPHTNLSIHPAGEKQPTPFGLHDMPGNIREWCDDVYDQSFYGTAAASGLDPVATSGSVYQVTRSGTFDHSAPVCRSASRHGSRATTRYYCYGFRPVRPLSE